MLVLGYAVAFNIRKLKSDFGVMTRAFRMPVLLARRAGNSIATKRRRDVYVTTELPQAVVMAEAIKFAAISRFKNPARLSCCAE